MEGTTIAAIIAASGAVAVGALKLLKPKPKEGVTSTIGDVSGSVVAVGTNINQSSIVHHHHAEQTRSADPFYGKAESKPTLLDIMNDLEKERRPYERSQVPKLYIGLRVSWPVLFHGVWEPSFGDLASVRLTTRAHRLYGVVTNIDLDKYPKMKSIDRNHKAWVEGKIWRVDSVNVYLEDKAEITLE
jgi:hypothetical protein